MIVNTLALKTQLKKLEVKDAEKRVRIMREYFYNSGWVH